MDFGTVRKKLDCGAYSNLEQFEVGTQMSYEQEYLGCFQTLDSIQRHYINDVKLSVHPFYMSNSYNACSSPQSLARFEVFSLDEVVTGRN